MINKLFKHQAERISSLMTPRVNKDGSFYAIDPILFDSDRILKVSSELALLEKISEYVDSGDVNTKEGLGLFIEAFNRR